MKAKPKEEKPLCQEQAAFLFKCPHAYHSTFSSSGTRRFPSGMGLSV